MRNTSGGEVPPISADVRARLAVFDRRQVMLEWIHERWAKTEERFHAPDPHRKAGYQSERHEWLSDAWAKGYGGGAWPFDIGRGMYDNRYLELVEDTAMDLRYSEIYRRATRQRLSIVYKRIFEQDEIDAAAITLTTNGTSGAATFVANTLNIPQYAGAQDYNNLFLLMGS